MMDKSKTPRYKVRQRHDPKRVGGVLDPSIIQGPFSVAPCQTLISRFATFSSPYSSSGGVLRRQSQPATGGGRVSQPAVHRRVRLCAVRVRGRVRL
jgi:hypothetical protein